MFTKKNEAGGMGGNQMVGGAPGAASHNNHSNEPRQAPAQSPARGTTMRSEPLGAGTIISSDLTIIGNVVSKGQVTLDGTIQGDMHCASLVVGENGEIDGGIIANEVVVHGRVTGAIRGDRVMLQKTAHVEGDIFHQEIGIEMGTLFDGTLKRTDKPTTMVQQPTVNKS